MYSKISKLNEKKRKAMQDLFKSMDKDGSGFLCINEFKEFVKSMNYDMNKVVILFGYLDKNKDNKINFEEFCKFLAEFESE